MALYAAMAWLTLTFSALTSGEQLGGASVQNQTQSARSSRLASLKARHSEILSELADLDEELAGDVENAPQLLQVSENLWEEEGWHNDCTGEGAPNLHVCYTGKGGVPYLGSESISMYFRTYSSYSHGGQVSLRGTGKKYFSCSHSQYTIKSKKMSAEFDYCLPQGIEIRELTHCKDQNTFKVGVYVSDAHMTVRATLRQKDCR